MLAKAILVHGVIGYKFCWLLPEDQNQGTPVEHESAETPIGNESGIDRTCSKKPTELLSEQEFRERFRILNDISIRLIDGDLVPTEKKSHNAIVFNKEQFNVELCFPLPSLFR